MRDQLIIFSGNSNLALAQRVCSDLKAPLGKALVSRFSDGEIRVEIRENVRGADVYVIQSTCPPVNQNLMELLVMIDALKRASAGRVNIVIPYYGYGRQDQKDRPRVSISAKVVADLLSVAGASRMITIDLHAEQIQGFFDFPVEDLQGIQVLLDDLKARLRGDEIIVAPDAGGVERTRKFADRLKVDLAITDYRKTEGVPYLHIVGEVKGRRVILLDDMVDTGRTLVRTAEGAKAAGAALIDAYCVHPLLSGQAVEYLEASPIQSLTTMDTVPLSREAAASAKIRTVSIGPMLAEAIQRVHREKTVSSLLGG